MLGTGTQRSCDMDSTESSSLSQRVGHSVHNTHKISSQNFCHKNAALFSKLIFYKAKNVHIVLLQHRNVEFFFPHRVYYKKNYIKLSIFLFLLTLKNTPERKKCYACSSREPGRKNYHPLYNKYVPLLFLNFYSNSLRSCVCKTHEFLSSRDEFVQS